ncbi:hypothetical protein B0H34DRAFT_712098 [Crassisporium funariophilum]|nr:hypothetical protein B0H34DRAFT_712098 [Crassisporium funariophilum]
MPTYPIQLTSLAGHAEQHRRPETSNLSRPPAAGGRPSALRQGPPASEPRQTQSVRFGTASIYRVSRTSPGN